VRDIYDLGDRLLIVATDRISAFDVVLPTGIPFKGEVLTRLSAFWFAQFSRIRHHLLELVEDVAQASRLWPYRRDAGATCIDQLRGRSMIVRKARVLPIEC